jgi:hypothetical protein
MQLPTSGSFCVFAWRGTTTTANVPRTEAVGFRTLSYSREQGSIDRAGATEEATTTLYVGLCNKNKILIRVRIIIVLPAPLEKELAVVANREVTRGTSDSLLETLTFVGQPI